VVPFLEHFSYLPHEVTAVLALSLAAGK
jgi:hypothetical protein